jgi:hypothetical protein
MVEHEFISKRQFALTSQFYKVDLGLYLNYKMISEFPPRSIGSLAIRIFMESPTIYISFSIPIALGAIVSKSHVGCKMA